LLLWAVFPPSNLKDWLEPAFEVFWSGIAAGSQIEKPDQNLNWTVKSGPKRRFRRNVQIAAGKV
jgi:hypothetical protein